MSGTNGGEGVAGAAGVAGASGPSGDTAKAGSLLADLRGGGMGAPDAAPVAAPAVRRPKVSMQTVVIAIVLAGSGGLLYAMRRHGMGAGMTFQTLKIDYPLDKVVGSLTADHERVLADLERGGQVNQVPAEQLGKNPFRLEVIGARVAVNPNDPDAEAKRLAEMSREAREARESEVIRALDSVRIQGVMGGPSPLAIVNERTVRVGDKVGGIFTVAAIDGLSVSLEADGKVYTVSMTDTEPAGSRRQEPTPRRK